MADRSDADQLKRAAAAHAVELVHDGMVLGLGTGSTVAHFVELLGQALDEGRLRDVKGIPSSVRTGREARHHGVPLTGFDEHLRVDLAVDGTDEVTPQLDLIKGMGGALLREKMVAQAADRFVVIADEGKAVDRLGTRSPLPVEVVDWGWQAHLPFLEGHGARVAVRRMEDGPPYKSDNGNLILDCTFEGGLEDPHAFEAELRGRAGVVESGLFLGLAHEAFLAGPDGVRTLTRAGT